MQAVVEKIFILINEFQTELYIALITICLLGAGASLMLGGEAREKLKKNWAYIILGVIIFGGAITLGAEYGGKLKF